MTDRLLELAERFDRQGLSLAELASRKLASDFQNDALAAAKAATDWLEAAAALRAKAQEQSHG